jgi:AcrR family transcriptional regulator
MASPRPRNAAQTRADILAAARRRFAAEGFERTTLRAIAADVGVDAALVTRYFGSKQDLFATATEFKIDLPDLSGVDPQDVPGMLLPRYFAVWEDDDTFLALLRSAGASRIAAETINKTLASGVAPALRAATPDNEDKRIAISDALVIGLAMTRSVLGTPAISALSREEFSRWVGPVLQLILTGPAPPEG